MKSQDERQFLAFNLFDEDDDGKLNVEEFTAMVRSTKESFQFFTPEKANNLDAARELATILFHNCHLDSNDPNSRIDER